MSVQQIGDKTHREDSAPLDASESAALGLLPDGNDYNHDADENLKSSPPLPQPPHQTVPSHRYRTAVEYQLERTERHDEVEPGLTQFRHRRELHVKQFYDMTKKAAMVGRRIDKLNDDVEKLRAQWGEIEREKSALLESRERYGEMILMQQSKVRKDDKTAKKYHDYLNLAEEVLALEDSEDEDVEGGDAAMVDWQASGRGGVVGEREQSAATAYEQEQDEEL